MEIWHGFLYGMLGGVLAELFGLFRLRQQAPKDLPIWLKSPFYWIVTLLMVLAGGGLVFVYLQSGVEMKAIVAVNIGASAPLIIGTLVAQTPALKVD